MIRASDRVSAVLAKDERLLEVFVQASSTFEKLRIPAMRKTMARLVTVEQAARVAGIDPVALVDRLNRATGGDAIEVEAVASTEPTEPASSLPAWLAALPADRLVELDVRDDLRKGQEPFHRIMGAVGTLPDDSVLCLRATFEPAPLYAVLGKRGLAHFTERLAADDWRVWFHRGEAAQVAPVVEAARADGGSDDDVVVLDVRDLEPPEPMVRTLEALASLPRGKTLVQINVRVPQFLLPKLTERGFTYEIREQSRDIVRLFIRHNET